MEVDKYNSNLRVSLSNEQEKVELIQAQIKVYPIK